MSCVDCALPFFKTFYLVSCLSRCIFAKVQRPVPKTIDNTYQRRQLVIMPTCGCKKNMLLAHKIELHPTPQQRKCLKKACGYGRHCQNHGFTWFNQKNSARHVLSKWSKSEVYQFVTKVSPAKFPCDRETPAVITV